MSHNVIAAVDDIFFAAKIRAVAEHLGVDVRFAKTMQTGKLRTTALAEFNNIFNLTSVASVTQNYGANWLRPATVQRGMNVRFGLQMRF